MPGPLMTDTEFGVFTCPSLDSISSTQDLFQVIDLLSHNPFSFRFMGLIILGRRHNCYNGWRSSFVSMEKLGE